MLGPARALNRPIPVFKKRSSKKRGQQPLHLFNVVSANLETHGDNFVGKLCIGTTNNVLPDEWTKCKAGLLKREEEDHLYLEFDSVSVLVKLMIEAEFIRDVISTKVFALQFSTENGEEVYVDFYFHKLPLPNFNKKIGSAIQALFYYIFNIAVESGDGEDPIDGMAGISQLYRDVRRLREKELDLGSEDVQHFRLKPQLRPYQADAVRWMLHREKHASDYQSSDTLHPLYQEVTLPSGRVLYYDKFSGYVDFTRPEIGQSSRGGILADEMGLGKTVEVLACILLHPGRSQSDHTYSAPKKAAQAKTPTVDKLSATRKRKRPTETDGEYVIQPKKLKVPDDWVKGSSKKSQVWVALNTWYTSTLQSVNCTSSSRKRSVTMPSVQCTCGNTDEDRIEHCVDCGKMQHGACLGYKRSFGDYRCPQCWMNQPPLECGATIIVSPVSLRTQWCKEVCKHMEGDFKVLQYEGATVTPVYPTQLQKYDLVITTYNVLQAELRLTETEKVVEFRRQRKYSPPGSPLTIVKWWRLCLDEAQTVESPTHMVAAMAQKLNAHFRWAVTGTPMSRDISDLYGLIDYLQMEPYNDQSTWKHVLLDPFLKGKPEAMHKFLAKVMWRTCKNDVLDQINIPKQTIEMHRLNFSQIEEFFYKKEHSTCSSRFLEVMTNVNRNKPLRSFERNVAKKLLGPLLSLRQLCTYPNSSRMRYLSTRKPVTSMKDLLEALILRNTNEAEESLRLVISSLNGLAGINILCESYDEAMDMYRKVLQLYTRFTEEEKVNKLTVDTLQVVHTMHNAAEVFVLHPSVNAHTLRDETLRRDCTELENKYIKKFIDQSLTALQEFIPLSVKVEKLRDKFELEPGQWCSDLLDWMCVSGYSEELENRILNALEVANIKNKLGSMSGKSLLLYLTNWDDQIAENRAAANDSVRNLFSHLPEEAFQISIDQVVVQQARNCHLRPEKKSKRQQTTCGLCEANELLKTYEFSLFTMTQRTENFKDMQLKGSWKPTAQEVILKTLVLFAKTRNADDEVVKDGETHLKLIQVLKKEFKEVRKLWTFLDQQICAHDELNMSKLRLTLKDNGQGDSNSNMQDEVKKLNSVLKNLQYNLENKLQTIHFLDEHELDYQRRFLQGEIDSNMQRFEQNLGIRKYLETLRSQSSSEGGLDPCPVCKNALDGCWGIIPCGHSYCLECTQFLVGHGCRSTIYCPVCRMPHHIRSISYVKPMDQQGGSSEVSLAGSDYSTKVEAVIKLLLQLRSEDKDVKVLLFSTWVAVLRYLQTALESNKIKTELSVGSIERHIENFKDKSKNITVLLLPISHGAKGLNLIEATQVILIEPLLNPGEELQAIGRVHRIGQTKPTVVHKFLINDSIEESIHTTISANTDHWEDSKITPNHLLGLFHNGTAEGDEEGIPPPVDPVTDEEGV